MLAGVHLHRATVGRNWVAPACLGWGQDIQFAVITTFLQPIALLILGVCYFSICYSKQLQHFSGNIKNWVQQQTLLVHIVWDLGLSPGSSQQGWLRGCAAYRITKGLMLRGVPHLMFCCHVLKILNFRTRGPRLSFFTRSCKPCSQFCCQVHYVFSCTAQVEGAATSRAWRSHGKRLKVVGLDSHHSMPLFKNTLLKCSWSTKC